jgi:2-keto-myo-inositol isomerase
VNPLRRCINGATTMPYPLEEDIRAAGAAGFEAVEIWQRKLGPYLERRSVGELRDLLDGNGLSVAAICPLFVHFGEEADRSLVELGRAAEIAVELNCPTLLVCVSGPPAGVTDEEARMLAAVEIGRAADVAARSDVGLAIEPLGRHPLVPGPREALDLIDRAGRSNVGLMLDTFHYYKSAVPLAEIAAIPIERLRILHINDCEDKPLEMLRDADRLYPTLGVIPAAAMLRPLIAAGYRGFASVEIFREEYWRLPIDEINRQARNYLDQLSEQCLGS